MLCAEMTLRPGQEAAYRYGVVLLFAFVAIIFFIITSDGPATRAIAVLIIGAMFAIAVVTGRGDAAMRGWSAAAIVVVVVGTAISAAADALPAWLGSTIACALVLGTIVELVSGMGRLLRSQGVTIQAVSGALAVYLLIGLFFALAVSVAAHVGHSDFFAQGTDGSQSQHVYFAFTTMTTTGYGDLTPAGPAGRAIAVIAMLLGQIYLVTVIAMLVSNFRRRRAA